MTTVPRWLRLQEKIDWLYFRLGQHYEDMQRRTPLDDAIDIATGLAEARNKGIRRIAREMKKLKKELSKETGEPASTEMEDQILAVPAPRHAKGS